MDTKQEAFGAQPLSCFGATSKPLRGACCIRVAVSRHKLAPRYRTVTGVWYYLVEKRVNREFKLKLVTCIGVSQPVEERAHWFIVRSIICSRGARPPNLSSLDLSSLRLALRRSFFSPLGESLRHLFLAGNPICLLPAYRERILGGSCGPGLLVLDDLPVSASERGLVAAAAAAAVTDAVMHGGQEPSCNRAVGPGGERRGSHEPLDVVHFGVKV